MRHVIVCKQNALDPVSIDALADALQKFQGAVVLVSHDFRLISKVSKEIWEVRDGQVHRWEGCVLSMRRIATIEALVALLYLLRKCPHKRWLASVRVCSMYMAVHAQDD